MLRIKTKIGTGKVYTLLHGRLWVTIMTKPDGKTNSTDADNLREAGENHLAYCLDLQGIVNERGTR